MTRSKQFCLAAILSVAFATPVLASGETATRPWSAPVGHRQLRAADIPPSVSPQTLDQEGINVAKTFNATIICRKFGARSSGLTTVCYYDCGGSEAAITVHLYDECPSWRLRWRFSRNSQFGPSGISH
jgi:hypothetical protein